ncbi:putative thiopurine S-methyltransferase [Triangularia verruculosa]|uniref:Thiopurine S-methyltransferase n=1 Tax=Triangularia verruculosa TaxID=2587418 RepID=A0AAN7AP51_9PEZI|nr:putative thiopurine S-methyltransferase [Triangularia verruculosa]
MASTTPTPGEPFVPTKLIKHFQANHTTRDAQSSGWSALWDSQQNDLWDRGKPSPALIDLIESSSWPASEGRRLKALIPGCGKGYDVVMLALHGFDVYGLEVSPTGVEAARAYAAEQLEAPLAYNYGEGNQERYQKDRRGEVTFLAGDFFKRDWESKCVRDGEAFGGFDLIYDYTFLCALLPEMRQDWGRRMGELLGPQPARLICLEFPLYKDLKIPGPPWGLREGIYYDVLAGGGTGVFDNDEAAQSALQRPNKGPLERLARIRPSRTYPQGEGTDHLGIWQLKSR